MGVMTILDQTSSVFVSVCMPAYNGSKYIQEQISSIIMSCNSWGGDWELLICDDFSEDNTLQIIRSYSETDPNIKVMSNNTNQGVLITVNKLLSSAKGRIIILSDQDDIWFEDRVSHTVNLFLRNRCSAVLCDNILIDGESNLLSSSYPPKILGKTRTGILYNFLRNQYLGCCMALDRAILTKLLPIPHYASMHDIWIGIVASLSSGVFHYNSPLVFYRRHASNVTGLKSASFFQAFYNRIIYVIMVLAATIRHFR